MATHPTEVPENTSLLQATKFMFSVPDLPFARYFCQSVNLPGLTANYAVHPTPFVDMKIHGDKLIYAPLVVTVLVDEDLKVWEETFNWMVSYGYPTTLQEYRHRGGQKRTPIYYDGVLTSLNNANLENVRFHFKELHPIGMSDIVFDTRQGAGELVYNITFVYDYYQIERISA